MVCPQKLDTLLVNNIFNSKVTVTIALERVQMISVAKGLALWGILQVLYVKLNIYKNFLNSQLQIRN